MYFPANNLYGTSLCEPLPIRGFRWLSPQEIARSNIISYDPTSNVGYILEVDLEYPESLHDSHNCYPRAPERLTITGDMLSPYCQEVLEASGSQPKPTTKLVPNLMNKTKYIVHVRNLQFYVGLGMKITKIHRVLEFQQSRWMEPYVAFNTEMRKNAKTEMDKNLYKLLVNAVFGKTMENVRAYKTVEIVTSQKRMSKVLKKPHFERAVTFRDNLVACSVRRTKILLNKPIYIGFSVLDLSKLHMYDFHYNYMKPKYNEDAQLLMTDTDSLMYEVQTRDIYEDMHADLDMFDTSDYPKDHKLYSEKNKKFLGKMKDELAGKPIDEFVGLRAKMYSLKHGRVEKKRAKGIKRQVVASVMSHTDYRDTLRNRAFMHHKMNMIRSYNHQLYAVCLNKRSLGCYDDKRFILNDGIHTLAYGHHKISRSNEQSSNGGGGSGGGGGVGGGGGGERA